MGLFSALFGKEKASTSSTETIDRTTTSEAQQLSDLTELVKALSSSTTTAGGAREEAGLTALMKQIEDSFMGQDVRSIAIKDAQGSIDAAMQRVLEMGLPDIQTSGTLSGGYDSTTQKLMRDNLTAQAAKAGAEVQQATIKDYGALQLEAIAQMIAGIRAGQSGSMVQTVEDEQSKVSTEQSSMLATEDVEGTTTSKGKSKGTKLSLGIGGE